MVERLAADLFRRHIGGGTGVFRHFFRLVGLGLRGIEVHQPHAGVARDHDVFRLEIQVHETAFVHVLQRNCHVNEDIADVLGKHGVGAGEEQLQIFALDVFHGQVKIAFDFAVSEVADDVFMVVNFGKNFAAAEKTPLGRKAEPQTVVQQPHRARLAL